MWTWAELGGAKARKAILVIQRLGYQGNRNLFASGNIES
jgi:hypothetical protein